MDMIRAMRCEVIEEEYAKALAKMEARNRRLALVAVRAREVRCQREPAWGWSPEERELWEALDMLRLGDCGEKVPDDAQK